MKKFALVMLSVLLVFSCALMAFADGESNTPANYSITVNQAIPGEVYTCYKIFDVTHGTMPDGASATDNDGSYTYTITPASQWWSTVTTTTTGTTHTAADTEFNVDGYHFKKTTLTDNGSPIYIVTIASEQASQQQAAAQTLLGKIAAVASTKSPAVQSQTAPAAVAPATTSTVTFTPSDAGYYFVNTTAGSLLMLDTNAPYVEITEKNTRATIDKKVSKTGTSGWTDDYVSVGVTDPVYFELILNPGKGISEAITVTDVMTPGIEAVMSQGQPEVTVKVGETTISPGADTYTLTSTDECHFAIVFSAAFVAAHSTDAVDGEGNPINSTPIVISYPAVLNGNAHIKGNTDDDSVNPAVEAFNTNTVTMTYSNQTQTDSVRVETYETDIVKTTSDTYHKKLLNGAEFKLYRSQNGNDEVGFVLEDTIYEIDPETSQPTQVVKQRIYRRAGENETPVAIQAGHVTLKGLGSGNYYLEETVAPDGYNELESRELLAVGTSNNPATVTNNTYVEGGLRVINYTGNELPSTGGIGTYLFYGIGAILVVGAVVVLVSKKRMHAYEG